MYTASRSPHHIIAGLVSLLPCWTSHIGWAFDTSVEEVMNNLHSLVVAKKVLYLVSPIYFVSATALFTSYLAREFPYVSEFKAISD